MIEIVLHLQLTMAADFKAKFYYTCIVKNLNLIFIVIYFLLLK